MEPRSKQTLVVRPETSRWLTKVTQSRYWSTVPMQVRYSVVDECENVENVLDLSNEALERVPAAETALNNET